MRREIITEKKEEFLRWLSERGLDVSLDRSDSDYTIRIKNWKGNRELCLGFLIKHWATGRGKDTWGYCVYHAAKDVAESDTEIRDLLTEIETHVPYRQAQTRGAG